jgi:hypothetical protein
MRRPLVDQDDVDPGPNEIGCRGLSDGAHAEHRNIGHLSASRPDLPFRPRPAV